MKASKSTIFIILFFGIIFADDYFATKDGIKEYKYRFDII